MDSWVRLLGGGVTPHPTPPAEPLFQSENVDSSRQILQVFLVGFIFQSKNSYLTPPSGFFASAGPVVDPFPRIFMYERSLDPFAPQLGILYDTNIYTNYTVFFNKLFDHNDVTN